MLLRGILIEIEIREGGTRASRVGCSSRERERSSLRDSAAACLLLLHYFFLFLLLDARSRSAALFMTRLAALNSAARCEHAPIEI